MKTLAPQELKFKDFAPLEDQVNILFWELLFKPLIEVIKGLLPKGTPPKELTNVSETKGFRDALRDGSIQMAMDAKTDKALFIFTGAKPNRKLVDTLRAFGAKLDRRTGAYVCELAEVPTWVRLDAESFTLASREAHAHLKLLLDDISTKIETAIDEYDLAKGADRAIASVDKGWKESAKTLEILPDLTPDGKAILGDNLVKSAKIPIKDWAKESIGRLRDQVEQNAMHGYRAADLAKRVRDEYGTTRAKSRLIARQETSNFMADFRAARAKEAGCRRYEWRCTMDERSRPSHKALNRKIFSYDAPPIVDPKTGRKANPGQDFNCRCVDIPILEAV